MKEIRRGRLRKHRCRGKLKKQQGRPQKIGWQDAVLQDLALDTNARHSSEDYGNAPLSYLLTFLAKLRV